jgi:hypothetical protein
MNEDITGLVWSIIGLLVTIGLTVFGVNYLNGVSCRSKYEGFQPQYTFFSGCRIMVDGKLTPVDIVREMK